MPKRNDSLNQTLDNQMHFTEDSVYLILQDQLKAIELEAEKVHYEAMNLQIKMKCDKEKDLVFYTSKIEIMTRDLAERAGRVGTLYRTIVQQNKNKETLSPQEEF